MNINSFKLQVITTNTSPKTPDTKPQSDIKAWGTQETPRCILSNRAKTSMGTQTQRPSSISITNSLWSNLILTLCPRWCLHRCSTSLSTI